MIWWEHRDVILRQAIGYVYENRCGKSREVVLLEVSHEGWPSVPVRPEGESYFRQRRYCSSYKSMDMWGNCTWGPVGSLFWLLCRINMRKDAAQAICSSLTPNSRLLRTLPQGWCRAEIVLGIGVSGCVFLWGHHKAWNENGLEVGE